jgi:S1-C subfamily serine protease
VLTALLLALLAPDMPALGDVVRVAGRSGMAHACPIEGGLLVTNAHVAIDQPTVRWSDGSGNEGTAELQASMLDADLAVLRIVRGHVGHEFPIAHEAPQPGEKVAIRGYRRDNRKVLLAERRVITKITRIEAGHLVFEDDAFPGSSGSCVLNVRGEVVAINSAGLGTDVQNERGGWAVAVWGEWGRELWPEAEQR